LCSIEKKQKKKKHGAAMSAEMLLLLLLVPFDVYVCFSEGNHRRRTQLLLRGKPASLSPT
jgi:hypothetical protein